MAAVFSFLLFLVGMSTGVFTKKNKLVQYIFIFLAYIFFRQSIYIIFFNHTLVQVLIKIMLDVPFIIGFVVGNKLWGKGLKPVEDSEL